MTSKCWMVSNRHPPTLFGVAAAGVAAAQFGILGSAAAQTGKPHCQRLSRGQTHLFLQSSRSTPAFSMSDTRKRGLPMVLRSFSCTAGLMIFSYVDVAAMLASAGYHVIIPYLRGYGTTRFLSRDIPEMENSGRDSCRYHSSYGRPGKSGVQQSAVRLGSTHQPTLSRHSGQSAARLWSP